MNNRRKEKTQEVVEVISMFLQASGLKKNADYTICTGELFIKCNPENVKKSKLIATLQQLFPQFMFTWETSRQMIW